MAAIAATEAHTAFYTSQLWFMDSCLLTLPSTLSEAGKPTLDIEASLPPFAYCSRGDHLYVPSAPCSLEFVKGRRKKERKKETKKENSTTFSRGSTYPKFYISELVNMFYFIHFQMVHPLILYKL